MTGLVVGGGVVVRPSPDQSDGEELLRSATRRRRSVVDVG